MTPLRATYRLQLEPAFGFDQAAALVPYLAELGVSHVYSSPIFEAVPGSRHGYDIVDPARVREELGGAEGRTRLVHALRCRGLGLVADIVPNHLALEGNAWWTDVLQRGPESPYFRFFDLDFTSDRDAGIDPTLIVIPILGEPYGTELESGALHLVVEHGRFRLAYANHRFPLSAPSHAELRSHAGASADHTALQAIADAVNGDVERLHALLEVQHYRLTWWRLARDEHPYRRFFDINGLIGMRVNDDVVFAAMHRLVGEWVADGSVDGVRVDHVDGLADPAAYLHALRAMAPDLWIAVEKILAPGEALPPWPVDGTTGYEFGALVTRLLTASEAEAPLTALYERFTGLSDGFHDVDEDARYEVLDHWLAGDAKRVALALYRLCQRDIRLRDYSVRDMLAVVHEVVAGCPVYRTYVTPDGPSPADAAILASLCERVRLRRPDVPPPLVDRLAQLFATGGTDQVEREFVSRLQQLCTAVAAKAVEDTAFFRYTRYLALNEVGADPAVFSSSVADFHAAAAAWQQQPRGLRSTSTHDSKRSEDVRARLTVLSEMPDAWAETVDRWSAHAEAYRIDGQPDRNFELYLYQSLVGAWPVSRERAHAHGEKAAREAKLFTNWLSPSPEYERALHHFIDGLFDDRTFPAEVEALVASLHPADWHKALAQQLLKLTVPGIPDLYQGSELWHLALSDPDNRTIVDYDLRRARLAECAELTSADVLARMEEGLPKLWITQRALALRARSTDLSDGDAPCTPLAATGTRAGDLLAYLRGTSVAVVVPLRTRNADWRDTAVTLPSGAWRHVLAEVTLDGGPCDVQALFSAFPVALLERGT